MTNRTQLAAPSTERQRYLEGLRRGFQADYPPQSAAEQVLLDEFIAAAQRLFHLNRLEADHLQGSPDLDTLGQISRQRTAADRSFHRSRKVLEQQKAQRISRLQNEPNSPPPVATTPVPEKSTNKPNPAPVRNKPKPDPADEPTCRALEQQIMEHGRSAAFREDDPETCYSDDLLELYFDLKSNLPLAPLQHHIQALTEALS